MPLALHVMVNIEIIETSWFGKRDIQPLKGEEKCEGLKQTCENIENGINVGLQSSITVQMLW